MHTIRKNFYLPFSINILLKNMFQDEFKSKNIEEVKDFFYWFKEFVEKYESENIISWDPNKNRTKRTELVLSIMSLYNFDKGRYVFFNKRYLSNVIDLWKNLLQYPEIKDKVMEWINIYEKRLQIKGNLSEIGERFFDFSSSVRSLPFPFSQVLEYEASPYWGAIMKDYRKLLGALAPIKIGIFHLPKTSTTDKAWSQNEETGEFTWNKVILDSNEPELLIVDMENDLMTNYYENPASVYLIMLIHSTYSKPVNVLGYMLMREFDGKVSMTKL